MKENKCGYQMHIFVTSFSAQHAPAWRCFCMVQPLRQPFRPKCTNRILQMHHQNPVVPPDSGVHPQNPVCTYSVIMVKSMIPSNAIWHRQIELIFLWNSVHFILNHAISNVMHWATICLAALFCSLYINPLSGLFLINLLLEEIIQFFSLNRQPYVFIVYNLSVSFSAYLLKCFEQCIHPVNLKGCGHEVVSTIARHHVKMVTYSLNLSMEDQLHPF